MINKTNPYLKDLVGELTSLYSIDSQEMGMAEWITKNTKRNKVPFTYTRYPFQQKIADDMHPDLVCIKCSQIGLTEIQLRKAIAFTYRNSGVITAYTLPDETLRDAASKTRINTILDESKIFNPLYSKSVVRSNEIKQISNSFLYMLVATESKAFSLPVDFLIIDERDLTADDIAVLFNSRMQNSDYKIKHEFSTPSFPEYGVDRTYSVSDQHEFFVKCGSCGLHQIPKFSDEFVRIPGLASETSIFDISSSMVQNLDLENSTIVCQKCNSPLDLGSPDREWVAKYPDRKHKRGYRVRPFSTNRLPVEYIVRQKLAYEENGFERGFYNTVLGEVYKDAKTRLSREAILNCLANPQDEMPPAGSPIFVGIDVGKICHMVIGSDPSLECKVYSLSEVPSSELVQRVSELSKRYKIVCGAIDMYPYTPTAYDVWRASDKRIWPVEYTIGPEVDYHYNPTTKEEYIRMNRTRALDYFVDKVNDGAIKFNGYARHKTTLLDHLRNMIRKEEPEKKAVWVKLNDNDHFFHACSYYTVAAKIAQHLKLARSEDTRTSLSILGVNTKEPEGLASRGSTIYQRIG